MLMRDGLRRRPDVHSRANDLCRLLHTMFGER
jgi:hypothetical protein